MKKIIFVLSLIWVSQVWAEENEEDVSKYIEFVNSDVMFSKNVKMVQDNFRYESESCDNIFRTTIAFKLPTNFKSELTKKEFTANLLLEAKKQLDKKFEAYFNKKHLKIEYLGPCIVRNLMFKFYEVKDASFRKKWKAMQELTYVTGDLDNSDIQQIARFSIIINDKQHEKRMTDFESYTERAARAKMLCKDSPRMISFNEVMDYCKYELSVSDDGSFNNVK